MTVTEDSTTATRNYNNNLTKLKQLLPTDLLDTVTTIADRRADKTTDRVRSEQERKLTRLQRNKDKNRPKTDDNWVRNISSRPLDKTETHVPSYGLKHSVTPKRIPTESIVSSVEAVLSRQPDLRPRHTMRQIAATRRRDRLLQQIASSDMWKSLSPRQNFVAAICRMNSNWFEFVRQIAATKWVQATLSQRVYASATNSCDKIKIDQWGSVNYFPMIPQKTIKNVDQNK